MFFYEDMKIRNQPRACIQSHQDLFFHYTLTILSHSNHSKVYSEPSQTSKMECFTKIDHG